MNPSESTNLSRKLVGRTVLWAIVLGLLISVAQIVLEYSWTKRQPDEDMEALIQMIHEPVTALVFTLDAGTAADLLGGTLSNPAVISSRIVLADGEPFAMREKPPSKGRLRGLNDLLFGHVRHYEWQLTRDLPGGTERLGSLQIEVDTYHYGSVFLDRALTIAASTLLYAFMLSAVLLLVFHLLVTKPLVRVIDSIARTGDAPEKARLVEPSGHADDEIGLLVRHTNAHLQTIDTSLDQLRDAEGRLKAYSDGLESTVAERTRELSRSMEELQTAHHQLIQSEKLAALGGLVAGVAHEVNTPLGISVTASSVVAETLAELQRRFDEKTLSSDQFQQLLGRARDGNAMLSTNVNRAAKLISDFKKTAVDQVSESRNEFGVLDTIAALVASLHPETRKISVEPILECPADLRMNSLPGVLTQVVSNLIVNSVRHAFAETEQPEIRICITASDDRVVLEYSDNGSGVPEALHARIFEPFFTTKRGQGGSGLGLNIVYNLVTRKLQGRLDFSSEPGRGVHFRIDMPRQLPPDQPSRDGRPVPLSAPIS
ncbi:MAG: hypothetical protein KIT73_06145 [Burkholderiales bacterium]|nr:hypothetical protein [Burkholderiales bacterium]